MEYLPVLAMEEVSSADCEDCDYPCSLQSPFHSKNMWKIIQSRFGGLEEKVFLHQKNHVQMMLGLVPVIGFGHEFIANFVCLKFKMKFA